MYPSIAGIVDWATDKKHPDQRRPARKTAVAPAPVRLEEGWRRDGWRGVPARALLRRPRDGVVRGRARGRARADRPRQGETGRAQTPTRTPRRAGLRGATGAGTRRRVGDDLQRRGVAGLVAGQGRNHLPALGGGKEILVHGPRLQIWRGATDNDGLKLQDSTGCPLGRWLAQGLGKLELRPVAASIKRRRGEGSEVTFSTEHIGACAASPRAVRHRCGYTLRLDGSLLAENVFDVDEAVPDLPRLGVVLALRGGLENLRWFGRGPLENYVDRRRTSLVDLHTDTVTGQCVPYVMPQEHGNHTADDLFAVRHPFDLKPRAETILKLDYQRRGLGTASCGLDALERYRIAPGRYAWSYTPEPVER